MTRIGLGRGTGWPVEDGATSTNRQVVKGLSGRKIVIYFQFINFFIENKKYLKLLPVVFFKPIQMKKKILSSY